MGFVSHSVARRSTFVIALTLLATLFVGFRPEQTALAARAASGSGAVPVTTHPHATVPSLLQTKLGTHPNPALGALGDKSANKWLDGAMQSTFDTQCISGDSGFVTTEFVGYWGNEEVTSPRVGDVYYGRVIVAGVGLPCAGPFAHIEIVLPKDTFLAIDANNPVVCGTAPSINDPFTQLPADECMQKPYKGSYGWAMDKANGEPWDVRDGKMVQVLFPLVSMKKLSGIASNDYLTAGVQAIDGELDPWDNPKMGVFVADNPPAVQYDQQSTINITSSGARTTGYVLNHYTAGTAVFQMGTTTRYGLTGQPVAIAGDSNSFSVYQNWQHLSPNTTYHWRIVFTGADGRVVRGEDQTFRTKSSPGGNSERRRP